MGVNKEILRNVQAESEKADRAKEGSPARKKAIAAIAVWEQVLGSVTNLEAARVIKQLPPLEAQTSTGSAQESAQPPTAARITAVETVTPPKPQTERERILAIDDLWVRTRELLTLVREPTPQEREVLERKLGYVVLSTPKRSLMAAVNGDRSYFWNDQMEYLNQRPVLRDYTPPAALLVAIRKDPEQMYIPGSFNIPHDSLLKMAEEHSQSDIEPELPDAKAIIIPAITLVDLDMGWGQRPQTAGQKKLFTHNYARALDRYELAGGVGAAAVGRLVPGSPLRVNEWAADDGSPETGGLSAVVFIGNK